MNISEAVTEACKEDTLEDALTFICIWEMERIVVRVREHPGTWDSCFGICIKTVMEKYNASKTNTP